MKGVSNLEIKRGTIFGRPLRKNYRLFRIRELKNNFRKKYILENLYVVKDNGSSPWKSFGYPGVSWK